MSQTRRLSSRDYEIGAIRAARSNRRKALSIWLMGAGTALVFFGLSVGGWSG